MRTKINAIRVQQRFAWPDWFHDAVTQNLIVTHGIGKFGSGPVFCTVKTFDGWAMAGDGQWIVSAIPGEFAVMSDAAFSRRYEPVEETVAL